MLRILLLSALAALSAAQRSADPRNAAILNEERYLSVGGEFGAAYQQDDGVQFKEESDADGTRRGTYSYVDPTGVRRTISYVAGKNGFQPTGDHIPAAPAPVTNPLPQYNPPAQQQAQYNPPPQQYSSQQQEDDGQWIDDTKQDYPPNSPATWSAPARQQSWNTAPAQASQPSWNTAPVQAPQPSWNAAPTPAPQASWNAAPAQAPQPSWNAAPAPQQWASAPTPAPQRWSAPLEPTPAPHRFFPPGKLNLNRSPDGFSFSFKKS